MSEIYYLEIDDVMNIHARQIAEFGGGDGIRDAGLVESSLQRPKSGYYRDIIEEAASLWESLTITDGFINGNKRVGFASAYTFLGVNGIKIATQPNEILKFIYSNLEAGTFNKDILDAWLRDNTQPM